MPIAARQLQHHFSCATVSTINRQQEKFKQALLAGMAVVAALATVQQVLTATATFKKKQQSTVRDYDGNHRWQ